MSYCPNVNIGPWKPIGVYKKCGEVRGILIKDSLLLSDLGFYLILAGDERKGALLRRGLRHGG